MIPVATSREMRAADEASAEQQQVLIRRAAWAVARESRRLMRGAYGRRVVVVAGRGNNGADGREAARLLMMRGARTLVLEAGECDAVPDCDLVIDAAYGTGFRGVYRPPESRVTTLAVDIPSGVVADTGEIAGGAMTATTTVTFAALKPGLLFGPGADVAGRVVLADIGLDVAATRVNLVEKVDVIARWNARARNAHKWDSAVLVVAGQPGMIGAAVLAARAAQRAGAGIVHLAIPGVEPRDLPVGDFVCHSLLGASWAHGLQAVTSRVKACVIGPGLGVAPETQSEVRQLLEVIEVPSVVDADALVSFAGSRIGGLRVRSAPTILTPHDGEFSRLSDAGVGVDRISAARRLASSSGVTVLLKGPTTTISNSGGEVLLTSMSDARLATAGSGDVLSGVMAAFLARGFEPAWAAAGAAFVHGSAARSCGLSEGLVASDLPAAVARWLSSEVRGSAPRSRLV